MWYFAILSPSISFSLREKGNREVQVQVFCFCSFNFSVDDSE